MPFRGVREHLGPVTASLFSSFENVVREQQFHLAVALDIEEGWHLYGPNPQAEFLIPTTVDVRASEALEIGNVRAPQPRKKHDPVLDQVLATYEGRTWHFFPVTVPERLPAFRRIREYTRGNPGLMAGGFRPSKMRKSVKGLSALGFFALAGTAVMFLSGALEDHADPASRAFCASSFFSQSRR